MVSRRNLTVMILVFVIVVGIEVYNSLNFDLSPPSHERVAAVSPRFSREAPVESAEPEQSQPQPVQSNSVTSTAIVSSTTTSHSSSTQVTSSLKVSVHGPGTSGNESRTLAAIDWSAGGPIAPGETRNSSKVLFTNEGEEPVMLYVSLANWAFGDAQGNMLSTDYSKYFSLTWDHDNAEIAANETRPVTLSLTVSPWIVDVATFSFDIVITIEY